MSRDRADPGRSEPLVAVRSATFGYDSCPVLSDIDVSIERGSTCVLVGPNGAGKSTFVHLVCGNVFPRSGTVRIGGVDPARATKGRSPIAVVPQRNALFARLTVRENVEILSRLADRPSGQAECERALRMASALGYADRRIDELSGGQARLANIAAALAGEPRLLVLDEPTVGVDGAGRAALTDAVERLRADGIAVLIVTHDLDFAEAVATHVVVLVGGRVAMKGVLPSLVADTLGAQAVEITALFRADPSDAEGAILAENGFRPNGGARSWSAIQRDAIAPIRLDTLGGALPNLSEVRSRRAGLPALILAASVAPRDIPT